MEIILELEWKIISTNPQKNLFVRILSTAWKHCSDVTLPDFHGTLLIGYCDYHPVCFLTTSCWFFTTLRILNEMPCHPVWSLARPGQMRNIPGSAPGCRTRNRVKLSSNQAEPVQAIKSGVAYFPSISCTTSWRRSRVVPGPGSTWRTVAISRSGFTRNRRA